MILRELALAWVRTTCPRSDVQDHFLQELNDALRQGVGCSFIMGRKLTKVGEPYLVYCFCGELFAFQLTPRQAARLKVNDAMLVTARGLTQHNHEPRPEPPVRLERADVDSADALRRPMPITGMLKYRTEQWWTIPLAVQVACEPAGRISMVLYHHLDHLPRGEGTIRFSLSSIEELLDRHGQPFAGVLPLFFQLCIVGEPEKDRSAFPFAALNRPGQLRPYGPQVPVLMPAVPQKLGELFVPRLPMPTLMSPQTMSFPHHPDPTSQAPQASPAGVRSRAISDIRAVLVEVD